MSAATYWRTAGEETAVALEAERAPITESKRGQVPRGRRRLRVSRFLLIGRMRRLWPALAGLACLLAAVVLVVAVVRGGPEERSVGNTAAIRGRVESPEKPHEAKARARSARPARGGSPPRAADRSTTADKGKRASEYDAPDAPPTAAPSPASPIDPPVAPPVSPEPANAGAVEPPPAEPKPAESSPASDFSFEAAEIPVSG